MIEEKNWFGEYLFYSRYLCTKNDEFYKLIKAVGLKELYKSNKDELYKYLCKLINVEYIDNNLKIEKLIKKLGYLRNIRKL